MTNQKFIDYAKFKVQQWLWHNAENGEMYMDVYDKLENKCFKVTD